MEQLASPRARPDTASTQEQKGMKKTETCAWPSSSFPARTISTVSLTASPSLSAASQRWAAFPRQCQTSPTWPSGWAQVVFSHPVRPSRHSPPVSILRRDALLGTPSQSPVQAGGGRRTCERRWATTTTAVAAPLPPTVATAVAEECPSSAVGATFIEEGTPRLGGQRTGLRLLATMRRGRPPQPC